MSKFSVEIEKINKDPEVIVYRNLITKEECNHLIALADPYVARSGTFSSKTDKRRTSSSTFCNKFPKDPVLRKVMDRCAILANYPRNHVEMPQIVKYLPGEQYMTHSDCYPHTAGSYLKSGQRDYTFFLYLNQPDDLTTTIEDSGTGRSSGEIIEAGGETEFPGINLKVKPETGMAVCWRNINVATGEDEEYGRIKHRGLPPKNWTKYGMNIWIRHKAWP